MDKAKCARKIDVSKLIWAALRGVIGKLLRSSKIGTNLDKPPISTASKTYLFPLQRRLAENKERQLVLAPFHRGTFDPESKSLARRSTAHALKLARLANIKIHFEILQELLI